MLTAKFTFKGVPSHAAAAPERGRSALDGVEIHNIAVNYLREHVPQETRIHYTITNGGDQPNIVPANAQSFSYVRHHDPAVVQDVWNRVKKAADGAALATGTEVSVEIIGGSYSTPPNDTLGRVVDASLNRVGGYRFTAEEAAYAKAVAATLPGGDGDPGDPSKIGAYEFGRKGSASSDVGDIGWVVPTASLGTATWPAGTPPHSWQAASATGHQHRCQGGGGGGQDACPFRHGTVSQTGDRREGEGRASEKPGQGFHMHAPAGRPRPGSGLHRSARCRGLKQAPVLDKTQESLKILDLRRRGSWIGERHLLF